MSRLNYPVPNRFSKNFLQEAARAYPSFQTKALLEASERVTESLKDMVPSTHYDYYYEQADKTTAITDVADDDQFRCSTRALLYKHVERNYRDRLGDLLKTKIPQEEDELYLDEAPAQKPANR